MRHVTVHNNAVLYFELELWPFHACNDVCGTLARKFAFRFWQNLVVHINVFFLAFKYKSWLWMRYYPWMIKLYIHNDLLNKVEYQLYWHLYIIVMSPWSLIISWYVRDTSYFNWIQNPILTKPLWSPISMSWTSPSIIYIYWPVLNRLTRMSHDKSV